ncbi:MAG: hypothetical protein AAB229_03385, partial [Candidatus Hydrogenedentota bacterium]
MQPCASSIGRLIGCLLNPFALRATPFVLCGVLLGLNSNPAYAQAIVAANSFTTAGGTFQDAVLPGDTFQIPFTVTNNDTGLSADLASVSFIYNNIAAAPASDFFSVNGTMLKYFMVLDSAGVPVGFTAGGAGPGTVITISTPGLQRMDTSSSVLFYLVIATSDTESKQTLFDLTVSTTATGGVAITGPTMTAHSINSMDLQIVRPVMNRRDNTPGGDIFVVGANSGPFKLYDWNIVPRTSGTITVTGSNITCSNVRGFVPGAQSFSNLTPLGFTGDIEKFTHTVGAVNHDFNRRGTATANQLRAWSTADTLYRISIGLDTATTVAAGATQQFDFTFNTNAYISDLPNPGGFVPGDAFFTSYDTMSLSLSVSGSNFLKNTRNGVLYDSSTHTPICYLGLYVEP